MLYARSESSPVCAEMIAVRTFRCIASTVAYMKADHVHVQGVAVGDRTYLGIYASKYYGVSQT